ncbi:hypothetical protein FPV67DRAFT_1454426 [Lyophyllum atratum]|nr:hypothetical protein FPV67DRAFT_1454426 [Lyophyllum atratum]
MSFRIGRVAVSARFDPSVPTSRLPHSVLSSILGSTARASTGSITLPVTAHYASSSTFTCLIPLNIVPSADVVFDLDWFAGFREHLIASDLQPPRAVDFDLATFQPTLSLYSRPVMTTDAATTSTYCEPNIAHILATLMDRESPHFVLDTFDESILLDSLREHGIAPGLSPHVNQRLLCHHLMFGVCAMRGTPTCQFIAGSAPSTLLRTRVVDAVIDSMRTDKFSHDLLEIVCAGIGYRVGPGNKKDIIQNQLRAFRAVIERDLCSHEFLMQCDEITRPQLLETAAAHGFSITGNMADLKDGILLYISLGTCLHGSTFSPPACADFSQDMPSAGGQNNDELQGHLFISMAPKIALKPLRRLLKCHDIDHDTAAGLAKLRKTLVRHGRRLLNGKESSLDAMRLSLPDRLKMRKVSADWPSKLSADFKDKLIHRVMLCERKLVLVAARPS